jgi:hypothetical protein
MSSLSAAMNSMSGVVVTDWSQYLGRQTEGFRIEKIVTLSSGILGIGMALAVALLVESRNWNLLEMVGRMNNLLVGPIAVLFFAGMLFRWVGKEAVLVAFASAVSISLLISFGKELLGLENSISFIWVVPVSFLVGLLVAAAIGRILPPPSKPIQNLTVSGLSRRPAGPMGDAPRQPATTSSGSD